MAGSPRAQRVLVDAISAAQPWKPVLTASGIHENLARSDLAVQTQPCPRHISTRPTIEDSLGRVRGTASHERYRPLDSAH